MSSEPADHAATTDQAGAQRWSAEVQQILSGDLAIALAYITPAEGVVLSPVTNFGLNDPVTGTVTVLSSLGAWKKLERMQRNPHVALAYHTRRHGFSNRPEYVLVQGDAKFSLTPDRAWLEEITPNWERFMGPRYTGAVRGWLTDVYHWQRVGVQINVKRVIVWPDLGCRKPPRVFGSPLDHPPAVRQKPPKNGTEPRVNLKRSAGRIARMPDTLLGWVDGDGFPMVLPTKVLETSTEGLRLAARPGSLPQGGRRAGLTAHSFSAHALGQEQYVHTGWLTVNDDDRTVRYSPHTRSSYHMPPSRLLYPILAGAFTRLGLRKAKQSGFLEPRSLTLYYARISHPSNAARLMLEHKGLPFRLVDIRPGMQPLITRLHGFSGITVPALTIDGKRVQGSIAIAKALDELQPERRLYPLDRGHREAVQSAEAWAERELQPVPRDVFRWALVAKPELIPYVAEEFQRLKPGWLFAKIERRPLARLAENGGGTPDRVRADVINLPAMLSKVEQLLDAEIIGGEELNAADFQIATCLQAITFLDDLRPLISPRLRAYAASIWPEETIRFPSALPSEWLAYAGVSHVGNGGALRRAETVG
jgi:glutathione S-transferase